MTFLLILEINMWEVEEINIHFTFLDNAVSYNCFQCRGQCCFLKNNLLLTKKSSSKFIRNNENHDDVVKMLFDFSQTLESNYTLLNCGRNCWFHTDDGCEITCYGLDKPLTCQLYPLKIKKIKNWYIVSFHPCPRFEYENDSPTAINQEDCLPILHEYIRSKVPITTLDTGVSKNRLEFELDYQKMFKNRMKYRLLNCKASIIDEYLMFYLEFRWDKFSMELTPSQSDTLFVIFKETFYKNMDRLKLFNRTNQYIILRNEFSKDVRNKHKLRLLK